MNHAGARSQLDALWRHVLSFTEVGRAIGTRIDMGESADAVMSDFPLSPAMNTLGLPDWAGPVPFEVPECGSLWSLDLAQRSVLYEGLGYIDPSLTFAAPGPGMAAFI